MKIYLAARYSRIDEINRYADQLRALGFEITSRWLEGNHQAENDQLGTGAAAERFAQEDWHDLQSAELVVSFTEAPRTSNSRGGRHVEFGAALAWGKTCIVVGPRENVFHCLPDVTVFHSWESFMHGLRSGLEAHEVDRSAVLRDALAFAIEGQP